MSPPEGVAEPGHARSTMYPLLYRDGDQAEPRYLSGTARPSPAPIPGCLRLALCLPMASELNQGFSAKHVSQSSGPQGQPPVPCLGWDLSAQSGPCLLHLWRA